MEESTTMPSKYIISLMKDSVAASANEIMFAKV